MTEDHEDTAAAAERELADMEERSARVGTVTAEAGATTVPALGV